MKWERFNKDTKEEHMMHLQKNISAMWAGAAVLFLGASICAAQVQTTTTTSQGTATQTTTVEKAQVVYVSGNSLVVKMADGSMRHFNVPDSVKITVNGQQLSVHDLKPGMTLQRKITTTTTPETIKTVQTVTGKVWQVSPPSSVILTLADGKNQEFKIPDGQKFNVDGQVVDAWGLKKDMTISATKVVETPTNIVAQQAKITGKMPPAPQAPPANVPLLVIIEE
jgi:hypothetical protein